MLENRPLPFVRPSSRKKITGNDSRAISTSMNCLDIIEASTHSVGESRRGGRFFQISGRSQFPGKNHLLTNPARSCSRIEPAVRGARTQSGRATAPARIPAAPRLKYGFNRGSNYALDLGAPGTEFLDAEKRHQNPNSNARAPAETKIRKMSGRKSPQKVPVWRWLGSVRFAKTRWWRR
jgi:hypothetical protein